MSVPSSPSSGAPVTAPAAPPLHYDGVDSQLFAIYLKKWLLSIITFGIYSFWGKTEIRKYVWGHIRIGDDRLEYTGTGGELFKSFLIVMVVVILPLNVVYFGTVFATSAYGWPQWIEAAVTWGLIVLSLYLWGVATYLGIRYRMSRTQWHGVRGGLSGSAKAYSWRAFGLMILNSLCLGLRTPQTTVRLIDIVANNLSMGNARVSLTLDGARGPYQPYFIFWFIRALVILLCIGAIFYLVVNLDIGPDGGTSEEQIAAAAGGWMIGGVYGMLGLFYFVSLLRLMYQAELMRFLAPRLDVAGAMPGVTVSFKPMFWLYLSNALMVLCSIGLLTPVALHRRLRYYTENMSLGPLDGLTEIGQSEAQRPSRGEGLLEALDIDLG